MPHERKTKLVPAYKRRQRDRAAARASQSVVEQIEGIRRSLDRWGNCGSLLSEPPAARSFADRADSFLAALPQFVEEFNSFDIDQMPPDFKLRVALKLERLVSLGALASIPPHLAQPLAAHRSASGPGLSPGQVAAPGPRSGAAGTPGIGGVC